MCPTCKEEKAAISSMNVEDLGNNIKALLEEDEKAPKRGSG